MLLNVMKHNCFCQTYLSNLWRLHRMEGFANDDCETILKMPSYSRA